MTEHRQAQLFVNWYLAKVNLAELARLAFLRPLIRTGKGDTMTFAPNDCSGGMAQLPRWKCHKTVWAIEIQGITSEPGSGSALLHPVDGSGFSAFLVSRKYVDKHRPQPSGYYVKYEDGYESWSPKDIFEAGYDPL